MTRSYEQGTSLDASAQELLESFNGLLLREARKVAARRSSNNESESVSYRDILDSLGKRRERVRWRERAKFSVQVILTAVAISATVMSFAVTLLIVSSDDAGGSGAVSSSRSFFTTVLLAMLLIVSTAILFAFIREPKEGKSEKSRSRRWKALLARSSRRESELELLSGWSEFEALIKRELYTNPSDAPVYDLSGDIIRFSQRYDLNPEEIRSILRARNAVAHGSRATSLAEVRKNLLKLRSLLEKLSPLGPAGR